MTERIDVETDGFWSRAAQHPERTAIVAADGRTISYGTLLDDVNRISHVLQSLGLRRGDHLTFSMSRCPEVFEVVLACAQLGIWYTPASPELSSDELAHVLTDSDATVLIADAHGAPRAQEAADAARLRADYRLQFGRGPFIDLAEHRRTFAGLPPTGRAPGMALWYTSGTTGRPKGVIQRTPPVDMQELVEIAIAHAANYGWDEHDVALVQGPLYHAGPLVSALTMLHRGARVVLMDKWSPLNCLQLIERHRVTASMMVPTMLHRLLALPPQVRAAFDVRSLRRNGVMIGGSLCPPDLKAAMIRWWGPVFMESYGGSEGVFSRITSEESLEHPGSVGRGSGGTELHVLDAEGNDCPAFDVGTVYARFADIERHRPAYRNESAKTAASYVGELFTLGDLGYLDDDGWLFLVDRRSDLIVCGGVNVYPAEVERVLTQHPAVRDAAVIGLPHPEWGNTVHALIEASGDVAPESGDDALAREILDTCRAHLAPYKCPRSASFVPTLGRSEMGKLPRTKLREDHLSLLGRTHARVKEA